MPPKLKKSSGGKLSKGKGKSDGRGPRVKRDSDSALGSLVVLDQDGAEVSHRTNDCTHNHCTHTDWATLCTQQLEEL